MDGLTEFIQRQRELQLDYGYKYESMTLEERVKTIQDMYVAAVQELGEALNETSWKPWTTGGPVIHTDAFIGEISDTLQFILNMLFAAIPEANAETLVRLLNVKHEKKVAINRQRMADGYDGKSTKCPKCGRALDEVMIHEERSFLGWSQFCICGHLLSTTDSPAA
jgi:hypothetical protein